MGDPTLTPTSLDALQRDPRNRRRHPARNLDLLTASLKAVGAARSIVVDEANVILAGNGVAEAATAAGITKVRIVDAAPDELVAVRRSGLDEAQKRDLAIYDNRTAELAEWDVEQLRADKLDGQSFEPFWTPGEEAILLGQVVDPSWAGMPDFEQAHQLGWRTLKVHFTCQADWDAFAALLGQPLTEQTRFIWFPAVERERVVGEKEYRSDAAAVPDLHRLEGPR